MHNHNHNHSHNHKHKDNQNIHLGGTGLGGGTIRGLCKLSAQVDDPEEINELPYFISKIRNYFELENITEEDKKRTSLYKLQLNNLTDTKGDISNVDNYLKSLKQKKSDLSSSVAELLAKKAKEKKIMGNFPNTYTFTKNLAERYIQKNQGEVNKGCNFPIKLNKFVLIFSLRT